MNCKEINDSEIIAFFAVKIKQVSKEIFEFSTQREDSRVPIYQV